MRNLFIPTLSKTLAATATLITLGLSNHAALAQIYNDYQENERSLNSSVVIYEDCGYRGASRVVPSGDYPNMSDLGFDNDSVSSIRVPSGHEVTIYEDDRLGGTYARINRDISCFDKQWNDEVSSIRVVGKSRNDGRYSDHRYNDRDDESYRNRSSSRDRSGRNVTAKNVTRIVFEDRVLQQVNKRQWKIADARYGVSQYRETSRDSSSVYLQNDYTDERIRIDLFANDITFINGDGRTQRYPIQGKQSTLRPAPDTISKDNKESYRIDANGCFRYRAYTRGGEGGIRFHGKEGFHRFSKRGHKGRVCHDGVLTMEVDKTDLKTDVIVEIQGRKIRFAPNEQPTTYKNNWYRKLVKLNVH